MRRASRGTSSLFCYCGTSNASSKTPPGWNRPNRGHQRRTRRREPRRSGSLGIRSRRRRIVVEEPIIELDDGCAGHGAAVSPTGLAVRTSDSAGKIGNRMDGEGWGPEGGRSEIPFFGLKKPSVKKRVKTTLILRSTIIYTYDTTTLSRDSQSQKDKTKRRSSQNQKEEGREERRADITHVQVQLRRGRLPPPRPRRDDGGRRRAEPRRRRRRPLLQR